jgi:hypothetical protein
MKRFIIERKIPGFGSAAPKDVRAAAKISNDALAKLAPDVQWVQSFVTKDRTYCIYLATDEAAIREHGKLSGIPITKIIEVSRVLDPLSTKRIT